MKKEKNRVNANHGEKCEGECIDVIHHTKQPVRKR